MAIAGAGAAWVAGTLTTAERERLCRRVEAGFAEMRYAFLSRLALYASLVPALLLWLLPPHLHLLTFLAGQACAFAVAAGLSFDALGWRARQRLRGQEALVVQAPPRIWRRVESALLRVAALAAVILALPALELVRLPQEAVAVTARVWAWSALGLVACSIAAVPRRPRPVPAIRAVADTGRRAR